MGEPVHKHTTSDQWLTYKGTKQSPNKTQGSADSDCELIAWLMMAEECEDRQRSDNNLTQVSVSEGCLWWPDCWVAAARCRCGLWQRGETKQRESRRRAGSMCVVCGVSDSRAAGVWSGDVWVWVGVCVCAGAGEAGKPGTNQNKKDLHHDMKKVCHCLLTNKLWIN